jgi:hypothetical protein
MKKLFLLFTFTLLSGCANVMTYVPSFWDDNQSSKIIDVRLDIARLDCSQSQLAQVSKIRNDIEWFKLYSDSKGLRQTDVLNLIKPMQDTVEDWYKRVASGTQKDNSVYCELKKKILIEQSARASKAVLGRF